MKLESRRLAIQLERTLPTPALSPRRRRTFREAQAELGFWSEA
jgi:hypothetical protein